MPTITNKKFEEYKKDQELAKFVRGGYIYNQLESLKFQVKRRGAIILLLACTQIVTLFILLF